MCIHKTGVIDESDIKKYRLKINLKAEAQGFFFIENNWTCYRRNYFKVSTGFQLLDDLGNDVNDTESFQVSLRSDSLDGVGSEEVRSDVLSFRIGITSRAIGGGPLSSRIDIVQHTTKRDRGPQRVPDMFTVRPGARLSSQIADETVANFERIQFKSSTSTPKTGNVDVQAAASSQHQQFAQISLELYAVCKNGVKHSLAVLETCPLIVRSRSPSHYEGVEMSPMQRARMACGGGSVKAAAAGLKRGAGEKGAGLQRKGALASPSPSPFVKRPTRHLDSLPAISESSLRRIAPLPKSSPFYRAAPTIATTRQSEEPTVEKEISVTPSHECVEKLALRQEAAPSNPSIKIPCQQLNLQLTHLVP
ncbi:hypothetical protein BC829DRAFT_120321 [Chytridium lagenaria]|nr:hypothetical protein BC829DRAFT_120321 [Chytridium lagenaria]